MFFSQTDMPLERTAKIYEATLRIKQSRIINQYILISQKSKLCGYRSNSFTNFAYRSLNGFTTGSTNNARFYGFWLIFITFSDYSLYNKYCKRNHILRCTLSDFVKILFFFQQNKGGGSCLSSLTIFELRFS